MTTITKHPWLKTGKEILDLKIANILMLVDPIIQKYGTISLAGSSDLGKSYFLLQLADAVINGADTFLDFNLNVTHKSVIYVCTEDDEYSLCPRLMEMAKSKEDQSVYENLRIVFETNSLLSRLDELLKQKPSDIVIIDTFADIYDGDLNQSNRVRFFLQQYKEIANKYKSLLIFNHHCGKKNDYRAPHKDNLLGSQGFESSMRTVLEMRMDFNNPDKRHICIVKGNNIPSQYKHESFELNFTFENGFSNTGNRVPFEKLIKSDHDSSSEDLLKERVLKLHATGLSYVKIAEQLTKEGEKIRKSKVGQICKAFIDGNKYPNVEESEETDEDLADQEQDETDFKLDDEQTDNNYQEKEAA